MIAQWTLNRVDLDSDPGLFDGLVSPVPTAPTHACPAHFIMPPVRFSHPCTLLLRDWLQAVLVASQLANDQLCDSPCMIDGLFVVIATYTIR